MGGGDASIPCFHLWDAHLCHVDACLCCAPSFFVGRVFRGSHAASGGTPKEIHEATFDIVWDCRRADDGSPSHSRPHGPVHGGGVNVGGVMDVDSDGLCRRVAPYEAEVLSVAADVMKRLWFEDGGHNAPLLRYNNVKVL